ncbi:MAG: prepilin-type N-terminal cleavage/methylation domain-containing protein [bacterium]
MVIVRKRGAFTLIELLIVVAIIGILAAIAVPNFMNAQMRAKVAKVTAELRNLSVAMESYYLDEGNYPPFVVPNYHFIVLTSPIAYFTGLPDDIFDTGKQHPAVYGYVVENENINDGVLRGNQVFGGGKMQPSDAIERTWYGVSGALWIISSKGPDTYFEGDLHQSPLYPYNPSNGARSAGDLWRTGP